MLKIKITSFRRLGLIFVGLLCSTASVSFAMDEEKPSSSSTPSPSSSLPRVIRSNQELYAYGDEIFQAAEQKDYQRVLSLAEPYMSEDMTLNPSDYEHFLFRQLTALHVTYNHIRQKNIFDEQGAVAHQNQLKNWAECYLNPFENFISQEPSLNERLAVHRPMVFFYLGDAYQTLASIERSADTSSGISNTKQAVHYFEKSLEARLKLMGSDFYQTHSALLHPFMLNELTKTRRNLINLNVTLAIHNAADLKNNFAQQAHRYVNDLKKNCTNQEYLQSAAKSLEVMEQTLEFARLKASPEAFQGSTEAFNRTKFYRSQKITQMALSVADGKDMDRATAFRETIGFQENALKILVQMHKVGDSPDEIIDGLKAIEAQMGAKLLEELAPTSTASSSSSTALISQNTTQGISLDEIYKNLGIILGVEKVLQNYWMYISCLFIAGETDEGIKRAEILKNMEQKQHGQLSSKTRFLMAAYKNLQGDNEEWLMLEAELKKIADRKKEKKKAAKKRVHEKKLEELNASVAEEKKKAEVLEKQPQKKAVAAKRPVEKEDESASFEEPTVSAKQLKLERQQRHEEAEKARQEQEKASVNEEGKRSAEIIADAPKPNYKLLKMAERDALLLTSDQSLAQLYHLSSRPLKIDQEIEGNTWRFTREQFNTYMEALQCVSQEGRGVHLKSSLPKATHVLHGGYTVMVMNDFGGAATLPAWDKDYVPPYLRKQILEYRKNLRALKIKAQFRVAEM